MNLKRILLVGCGLLMLAALGFSAEQQTTAAVGQPIPEQVRVASERQMQEVWAEIQRMKQNDEEISEEVYNRYFALERILFPERLQDERSREGTLDQGQDRCPGLLINHTPPMNWVDYGQTYWTVNDCGRPRCRDGKDVIYQLNVVTEDFLVITTCGSGFDTWLCIYDNACCTGAPLYSNDDNEEACGYLTMRAAITGCFQPGTYFIVLDGYNRAAYGHYQLAITSPGNCIPPNPEFECPEGYLQHIEEAPDDEACGEGNMEVSCGDFVCGNVDESGDVDVFYFDVIECSEVTLSVRANDSPGQPAFNFGLDPYQILYNSNCEDAIADNNDFNNSDGEAQVFGDDARIRTLCLRPDRYWLEVGGQSNTTGPYIFDIQCSLCPIPPPLNAVVTFDDGFVCVSWPAGPPGTIYYVWRRIDDDDPSWELAATTTALFYCEPEPDFLIEFQVFNSACAFPEGGGPSLRHDNRSR